MGKSTTAIIMPSPAQIGPWGDQGWRLAGAIQYVSAGPDFLWADASVPGRPDSGASPAFASMGVRDAAVERADDIAVMALAVLDVPAWQKDLGAWWETKHRKSLTPVLERTVQGVSGQFKLGIVHTQSSSLGSPVSSQVVKRLVSLGFLVEEFRSANGAPSQP